MRATGERSAAKGYRTLYLNTNAIVIMVSITLAKYLHRQVVDFDAGDGDSASKLLGVIERYTDTKVAVLLLDTDTALFNCNKLRLLMALAAKDEEIFYSYSETTKKLQLLANPGALKTFLQVAWIDCYEPWVY